MFKAAIANRDMTPIPTLPPAHEAQLREFLLDAAQVFVLRMRLLRDAKDPRFYDADVKLFAAVLAELIEAPDDYAPDRTIQ